MVRITRFRFVLLLVTVVLSVPAMAVAVNPFVDVDTGRFYTASIDWAFSNGIVKGRTDTTFDPEASVTRGEVVTILKRYHDYATGAGAATLAGVDGATGPAGPAGPIGPTGPAGPSGATGPAGSSEVFFAKTSVNPLIYPMSVDPSDINVPPQTQAVFGTMVGWDGQPFSWGCYGIFGPTGSGQTMPANTYPPVPIPGLSVTLSANVNDLLFVTLDRSQPIPDVSNMCSQDPGFVPMTGTNVLGTPSACHTGLVVNGANPVSKMFESNLGHREWIVESAIDGPMTIQVATVDCQGWQFNGDVARVIVEQKHAIDVSAAP